MIKKLIFYRLELTSLNNYIFNNNNKLIYLKKKTKKVKFLIKWKNKCRLINSNKLKKIFKKFQ